MAGSLPASPRDTDPQSDVVLPAQSVALLRGPSPDRAYNNSDPNDFQLLARAMGLRPVFDYRVDPGSTPCRPDPPAAPEDDHRVAAKADR